MATKKNPFGDAFKVKDDDVFSELEETKKAEVPAVVKDKKITSKKPALTDENTIYKKYSFYIRPEQHTVLKLRAVQSDNPLEKDISAIVRLAIDEYLKK